MTRRFLEKRAMSVQKQATWTNATTGLGILDMPGRAAGGSAPINLLQPVERGAAPRMGRLATPTDGTRTVPTAECCTRQ
jgi:hypothetical protein